MTSNLKTATTKSKSFKKRIYHLWATKFVDSWIGEAWDGTPLFWAKRRDVDGMEEGDRPVRVRVTVELESARRKRVLRGSGG